MRRGTRRKPGRAAEVALEGLRERFEEWRRGRESRGPLPPGLLKEARGLVGPFYAGTVAKTLRLHYRHVGKVKSQSVASSPTPPTPIGPTFVKVPLEPREPMMGIGGGMVEFENPQGYRARVFLGQAPRNLVCDLLKAISGERR